MDAGGDRVLYPSNIAIIHEIYDSKYSQHGFSMELEKALDSECSIIVIEPTQLGDVTARWISVGNILHKTAVLSGISSIFSGYFWPDSLLPQGPLGALSLLSSSLYTLAWQFDHCVKYQVERDPRKLARIPILGALTSASPVVLVRRDDTKRKILHGIVTVTSTAFCIYRLYRIIK